MRANVNLLDKIIFFIVFPVVLLIVAFGLDEDEQEE